MAKFPKPETLEGTVRSVLPAKGFGFVTSTDGRSFFFHRTEVPDFDTLRIGSLVRFTAVMGEKGWRADAVVVLEP